MITKLAKDKKFRELVRAVVAYLKDPEQWEQEVEKVVRESIPSRDIDRFRKEILRRNPNMDSLADYFDVVAPRNSQQLAEMVKSMYWGIFDNTRDIRKRKPKTVPELPQEMTPIQKEIQQLQQENLELAEYGRMDEHNFKSQIQKARDKRPPIPRAARLNVINSYLDSLV